MKNILNISSTIWYPYTEGIKNVMCKFLMVTKWSDLENG